MGWLKIQFSIRKGGGAKNRYCPLGHKKRTDFFKRSILSPLDKIGPNQAGWKLAYSFPIKSEWFGGHEYRRKDFNYDAVNGEQGAKNKHKQSDNNVFTRQHHKDYEQKNDKTHHGRLYFDY